MTNLMDNSKINARNNMYGRLLMIKSSAKQVDDSMKASKPATADG